jgi:UDP-N-acetylglucosamine acyltransferase
MPAKVHPSAIVDPQARLGDAVVIGPFCVVGADVELAAGVELVSHVVIAGRTRIGAGTRIFPFVSLGHPPQDLKFSGEPSELIIGANNVIREHVTMNPGTRGDKMKTVVGDHGLFMVNTHIAHDCVIGNHVVMANNVALAGHVTVGDHVIIGGNSAIQQRVRLGAHSFVGGMSPVRHDLIPYGLATGDTAALNGLNLVGLKRRGFDREQIQTLLAAYRMLFEEEGEFRDRVDAARAQFGADDVVRPILDFIDADAVRNMMQPARMLHGP